MKARTPPFRAGVAPNRRRRSPSRKKSHQQRADHRAMVPVRNVAGPVMLMRRREFIGLARGCVLWPVRGRAQAVKRSYRIGVLESVPESSNSANLDAFRSALRSLGHVEGGDLIIDYRSSDGRSERFPELAAE